MDWYSFTNGIVFVCNCFDRKAVWVFGKTKGGKFDLWLLFVLSFCMLFVEKQSSALSEDGALRQFQVFWARSADSILTAATASSGTSVVVVVFFVFSSFIFDL